MAIFCITFRIHADNGYTERYDSVVEAIKKCCHGNVYWSEPTSFVLFENPSTSDKVSAYIDANSTFDDRKDILCVINLSQKGYSAIGNVTDQDLEKLMARR